MPAEGLAVWLRACRLPTMTAIEEQRVSRVDRENWDDQRRRQHWCESEAQDRQEMEVLFTFLAERCEWRSVLLTSNLFGPPGNGPPPGWAYPIPTNTRIVSGISDLTPEPVSVTRRHGQCSIS